MIVYLHGFNSGGASQVSYALSHYGLDTILARGYERGTGLSDPLNPECTLDDEVGDVNGVGNALGAVLTGLAQ